jgi:MFS family permease
VSVLAEFRALDRRNWYLAGARLVVTAGFSMVLPFLPMYLTGSRGERPIVAGLIWTLAGAVGAAMQWVAGTLSDRIGRRGVMMGSMVIRAVNLAALGYVTSTGASTLLLGTLIITNAALRAFFDPLANALVADFTPPEQRVSAFSLQRVGVNIGWSLGNATVVFAGTNPETFGKLFYWAAPITLLATLALIPVPEAPICVDIRPHWREMFAFLDNRPLVRFLVATVCFYILQVQLYQTLSIYGAQTLHLSFNRVAAFYWLNGIMVVLLQVPAAAYIRRIGTRGALVVGCFGYAASYAAVGLAQGFGSLLLCVACVTLAEIVTAPAQQATITSLAPAGRIGVYTGLFGLAQVTGQSAGPSIGTGMLDALPSRVAWLAWFVLALFGVAAALIYRTPNKR